MLYQAVLKGCEVYHDKQGRGLPFDPDYNDYVARVKRLTDGEGLDAHVVELLIQFVKSWQPRYRGSREKLLSALKMVSPVYLALSSSFLDLDFDRPVADHLTTKGAIEHVFQVIATCGPHCESTATSKILHMINPNLFVMWDRDIRGGYGVSGGEPAKEYAGKFLPRVQKLARRAVGQMMSAQGIAEADAIQRLTQGRHTLAKVIDEYNYAKFTLSADAVWEAE